MDVYFKAWSNMLCTAITVYSSYTIVIIHYNCLAISNVSLYEQLLLLVYVHTGLTLSRWNNTNSTNGAQNMSLTYTAGE